MKLIVANWKMNPGTAEEAVALAKASDIEGLVIAPPFPFLEAVAGVIKKAKLGAQDLFWEPRGAYTGEVSAEELKSLGLEYVIIGHSERRVNLGETDEMVAKKVKAAMDVGLTPILCVGESAAEHASGSTQEVISRQLKSDLSLIKDLRFALSDSRFALVIAYEPIWAIGTGTPETPQNTVNVVRYIKELLNTIPQIPTPIIIYGGSVTSGNAEEFFQYDEIEGALVGGASLKPEEIKKIVETSKK